MKPSPTAFPLLALAMAVTVLARAASAQEPASHPLLDTTAAARVAEDQVKSVSRLGLEMGRAPSVRAGWERRTGGWILGVGAGAGPGRDAVRARLTPAIRIGRALPAGFRVDGGLGVEWAWIDRQDNDREMEIQLELTTGWAWSDRLLVEGGVRRTDYRQASWEGVLRVALSRSSARPPSDPHRGAAAPDVPPDSARGESPPMDFGVPSSADRMGQLRLGIDRPSRTGRGLLLLASNPRGDPNPWKVEDTPNVDRLGMGAETWREGYGWSGWARWRSDLHTDPAIRDRVRETAAGLGFPVSWSLSGGGSWTSASGRAGAAADVRHHPQRFLWLPHLGSERTAETTAAAGRGTLGRASGHFRLSEVRPIAGRTLDPLRQVRAGAAWTWDRADGLTLGAEHERLRLAPGSDSDRRTRVTLSRQGTIWLRAGVGTDVSLAMRAGTPPPGAAEWTDEPAAVPGEDQGVRTRAEDPKAGLEAGAALHLRSRPSQMDYDVLVARGWAREDGEPREAPGDPVASLAAMLGWGPTAVEARASWGDPIWTGDGLERGHGGSLDVVWHGPVGHPRLEADARVRFAEWGPQAAWWREEPTAEATVTAGLLDASRNGVRLDLEASARTELVSERANLQEPAKVEVGLVVGGRLPAPSWVPPSRMTARLDDLLDAGVATRIGAPVRGRRLTVALRWGSG